MLTDTFNLLSEGRDIKNNLADFKQQLAAIEDIASVPAVITEGQKVFTELLHHDDPKVRKNAALILGMLHCQTALDDLYQGYISDETLYNKAAYLTAIQHLDYSSLTNALEEKRRDILSDELSIESKKHVLAELHELNQLLAPYYQNHDFTGFELVNECVLLTNRNLKQVTINELKKIPHKEFNAGVMVKTKQIEYVLNNVRTYSELLFVPENIKTCDPDPYVAARELMDAKITEYIEARLCDSSVPVRFRIDDRGKDTKVAADFAKKLGSELDYVSKGHLINSTSDYELEFRFIDNSDGRKIILLRFCSIWDKRFDYRRNSIAVSLKPYLAALFMQLSSKYFKQNAAVLDPFCGCGTMLVERDRIMPVRLCYGVDIFGEAIDAAQHNIKAAGLSSKCELIKKDFFDFHHEYKFDEIITDMPFVTLGKSLSDIDGIYKRFFKTVAQFCEKDAHLFIYSRNRDLLRRYSLASGFRLLEEYEISKLEKAYFFILQK